MNLKNNFEELRELAEAEGMSLFGVADITTARKDFILPQNVTDQLNFAISMGIALSEPVLETIESMPNQLYYFHYQRANILLDQTSLKVMSRIHKKGFKALPIPASQVMDWQKQIGSVSHREIARLAGHGWYGKNNLLVNKTYGSRVRYVTILTDLPLEAGIPSLDSCGSCSNCVGLCPAKAIAENGFDRNACHLKLKEFTKIQGIGQMICGVCIKACPGKTPLKAQ